MRRRALCAASAAGGGGGKPINTLSLHPTIYRGSLTIDYEFSDIPTSTIYIGIQTTGFAGYVDLFFPSGLQTGEKLDFDFGCSTPDIKVVDYSPMEDDNFVYKVEVI